MTPPNNHGDGHDDTPSDEPQNSSSAVTGAALDALSSLLDRFGAAASPPAPVDTGSGTTSGSTGSGALPGGLTERTAGADHDADPDDGEDETVGDDRDPASMSTQAPAGALPDDGEPLDVGNVDSEALTGSSDIAAPDAPTVRADPAPSSTPTTQRDDTAEIARTDDTPIDDAPIDDTPIDDDASAIGDAATEPEPFTPTLPPRDATPPVAVATRRTASRRTMTRWDRPAPPRDWRFVVGGLGRILIVVGLLMFGFVAYQLWGTGIETARAQSRLENQFQAALEQPVSPESPDPTSVLDSTTTSTTTPTTTPIPATNDPTDPTTSTPVAAPDQQIPPILPGQAIAKLEIPRIDKAGDDALYVLPGVDYKTLHDGPGHYPDTPLPGQLGNAAIAGHRSTSGAPFADVDQLTDGDEIVVTMLTGDRFVYEVTDVFIVAPSDYWVVGTTDPDVARLTLTSCHPRFSARQRIVVQASLRTEESPAPGLPTYYDLGQANDDDDVDTAVDGVVDGAPATTVVDGTVETLPTEQEPGLPDNSGSVVSGPDALTAGWFHDSAAWPHIAAWAVACSLLALAAAWLSRRFRSYPRGWSIAVLPFLVSLYFLYQNVNRLLPPGI